MTVALYLVFFGTLRLISQPLTLLLPRLPFPSSHFMLQ